MGYDFIAIAHVVVCEQLPNNARPYAECMYRTEYDTYYEVFRNNATTYYKGNNRTTSRTWSINISGADRIVETLLNNGIHASEFFSTSAHTAASLAPFLRELRQVERSHLENQTAALLVQLIEVLEYVCDDGILLNV